MELFTRLFGDLLALVYHCFDRIVIHGYLNGLSRPEQVVHFFHQVLGLAVADKEVLSQRTRDYQAWVEAYAGNHRIPIEWAEKGVRKEDYVLPALRCMDKRNTYGVYFIFKSMEQGRTFRISVPKYPTRDPNYRILAHQCSRFTHYYFYIRDEVLGPIILRVASFFPFHATYWLNGHSFIEQELKRAHIGFRKNDNAFLAVDDAAALQAAADRLSPQIIRRQLDYWTFLLGPKFSKRERSQMNLSRFSSMAQVEYCRNFIFTRHFPIHKIFERSCEIGLWRLTGNRISEIFGVRLTKKLRGKIATGIEQIEHGHHVFRAYWKWQCRRSCLDVWAATDGQYKRPANLCPTRHCQLGNLLAVSPPRTTANLLICGYQYESRPTVGSVGWVARRVRLAQLRVRRTRTAISTAETECRTLPMKAIARVARLFYGHNAVSARPAKIAQSKTRESRLAYPIRLACCQGMLRRGSRTFESFFNRRESTRKL